MVSVAFIAPFAAAATLRFVRAVAAQQGVRCGLITQESTDRLPHDVRDILDGHWRIDNALDAHQIADAARGLSQQIGPVQRLLGILEQAQVPIAEARALLGLPGMDAATADRFRDKARMKTALRESGLPCARHELVHSADDALDFAARVGFPLIVKPPDGAGARGTHRVEDATALRQALQINSVSADQPALLEEFMTGREFSFDSVFLQGQPVWHSFSHYLPAPLQVLEHPWMQWCVLLPRSIDDPQHQEAGSITARAVAALGLRQGFSHLEWFLRPDGTVAISEVGARPPGAGFMSLLSYAHDVDFYQAWARLVTFDQFDPPPRRFAVAGIYLRGQGGARVRAVHGLDAAQKELGSLVVEARLPRPGQPASGTYEGEGCIMIRHEETDVVRRAAARILELIRVEMA